jgi:hypothetical protein
MMAQLEGKHDARDAPLGGVFGHNMRSGILFVLLGAIAYSFTGEWDSPNWVFPNAVSVLLMTFGLTCILIGVVRREPVPLFEDRLVALDAIWFPLSLFAYVWLVANLGYLRVTMAYLAVLSIVLSSSRRLMSIILKIAGGIIGGLILYGIFAEGFNVRLPRG